MFAILAPWQGVKLAHLDTAPNAGAWVHMVSATAAAALGDKDSAKLGLLRVGEPADFIVFDARKYVMPSQPNFPTTRATLHVLIFSKSATGMCFDGGSHFLCAARAEMRQVR